jgi:DNA-binding LacI/PurR family transcriptional regulator
MKPVSVTIKDIARQLNISPSTVSRALQDHYDISRETKQLVNETAVRLNYRPNVVARGLKRQQTNTIGVIIPEIVHYFFSQVISGIEEIAYKEGYTVMICQSNEKSDREVNNVYTLMAHQVAGILVSVSKETSDFRHLFEIQKSGIPLVFFDRVASGLPADQVVINDREAACEATRHLLSTGRKKIIHFSGPMNLDISKERKEGFLQAFAEAGIAADDSWCLEADTFERAFEAVRRLRNNLPDAIFCTNDMTALGAMKSLRSLNVRIPEDVAVVGFSNGNFSEISEPSLTSVDQHGFEMGVLAMKMLLDRIREKGDGKPFITKVLKADLIVRDSSKKRPIR